MNKPSPPSHADVDADSTIRADKDRTARHGQTLPAQGETGSQEKVPRLPHERDESSDSQEVTKEPTTQRMGELAHADLERGLVDTDRRPVLDKAYEKAKK